MLKPMSSLENHFFTSKLVFPALQPSSHFGMWMLAYGMTLTLISDMDIYGPPMNVCGPHPVRQGPTSSVGNGNIGREKGRFTVVST